MHFSVIAALLGLLLVIFSVTMLVPIAFALWYNEPTVDIFLTAFTLTACSGALLWLPNKKQSHTLRTRDGFLITTLFWLVLGLFGALPLLLADSLSLSITDAIFESISGLTTTGATVITGLDDLPKSILYYRQQLQWLGGIGIIVIAIAILPMLGVGGMQLYRAETPGPMKDHKLTPRITSTAKALFTIYLLITIACGTSYWLAGMSPFDALSHSFSTVAIGGFSTHNASIGYFDNPFILVVAMAFMLIAGINFALHFFAYHNRSLAVYRQDSEFKFYLLVNLLAVVIVGAALIILNYQPIDQADQLLKAAFQVVSLSTTTGFVVGDYSQWPTFIPLFMFFLAFIGASAGSTGGGMKAIRVLLIIKQGYRELLRLIHPHAVIPIKVAGRPISNDVVSAVWSFFAFYVFAYIAMILMVLATGTDFLTAFSAVGASINNLGPGLGEVSEHYSGLSATAKWTLCLAMLLGRLEVFTVLVLLTPAFWRK
ncbi:MAG: TrkH family potassium uptake protein [Pseudomonadota bacterium]|nr:TrkH family potassium uptake protein [Pseudomonadota bacterium]